MTDRISGTGKLNRNCMEIEIIDLNNFHEKFIVAKLILIAEKGSGAPFRRVPAEKYAMKKHEPK